MAYISFQPKDYFNTSLYTGNGGNQTITGVGFKPDWTWWKSRDAGNSHALVDIVRGTNKVLYTDGTSTQQPISAQTFNSDGFALVQDGGANSINSNGSTKVAWSWLAGGSQGSSNTAGSINTTYTSVNTTAGVSISSYTGTGSNATVGHGLGVAPSVIITKPLASAQEWAVYHKSRGATKYLFLNETSAEQSGSVYWQDTEPDANVFSVGGSGPTNSASAMIAYCFAEKNGFSKFGTYTGNGDNTNGAFIYTGFKIGWLMIKCNDTSGEHWHIHDTKRQTFNVDNRYLLANTSDAESTSSSYAIDILSTGFKAITDNASTNASGKSYIYFAFAEEPLVSSNGVPATAR